jgi:hypothetical protein
MVVRNIYGNLSAGDRGTTTRFSIGVRLPWLSAGPKDLVGSAGGV